MGTDADEKPPQPRHQHALASHISERLRFGLLAFVNGLLVMWARTYGGWDCISSRNPFSCHSPSTAQVCVYEASTGVALCNVRKCSVIFMHNLKLPWGVDLPRPEEFGLSRAFCLP